MRGKHGWGLFWGTGAVIALILVPYFLFGRVMERWVVLFIGSRPGKIAGALVLCLLLTADIIVPLPSSLVSTAGGYFFGFVPGTALSTLGMSLGCLCGYWLGAHWGRPLAARLMPEDLRFLEGLQRRYGAWALAVARPLPVLAEASVLTAGVGRLPRPVFMLVSTLANLGVSAVYAAVGAGAAGRGSFLLAFAGAVILPGAAMWWRSRRRGGERKSRPTSG